MANPVTGLFRHLREGTLLDAVRRRAGLPPAASKVRWHGADSVEEAVRALTQRTREFLRERPGQHVLVLGDAGALREALCAALGAAQLDYRTATLESLPADASNLAGILDAHSGARRTTDAARRLAAHPALSAVPFEYAAGLYPERAAFERRDEYRSTWFVSPVLLDEPSPYAIYEESLQHFEQKCGLRDYLDLYQLLKGVVQRGVPGDVAEFGSYKGHSGWLIARTLQALGSDKRVFLFDMFEHFPTENLGVDRFWSATHAVSFEEVRGKFAELPQVTLVKGDFTQTLGSSGVDQVALAYIDCDSYRATRFLIDRLWDEKLSRGGTLVCEDYGHPALLGNRAAVHDGLDWRRGAIRFFSQFSGYYIVFKV